MGSAPLVSTYSIAACDLERGEWGVGVQSKFLAAGSIVPWAEPGVGAVATQALANPRYGPDGLALLRDGLSADETIAALVAADEGRDDRQVGVVDAQGRAATYTGKACLDWAGGTSGPGYAAQGNILVSEETVAGLVHGFEAGAGRPLAERLVDALAAAQLAGGDRRGQQAAGLLVVQKDGGYGGMDDVLVDLRVDDHPEPVAELKRLYGMHQLLFGKTPTDEWLPVDEALAEELQARLAALGYTDPSLEKSFNEWAGTANLEDRVNGVDRIDPVVLDRAPQALEPLAVAREPDAAGPLAQRRDRIGLGPGDDEHRAVPFARKRVHEELKPDRERESLVRLLPAEGHELLGRGVSRQHVAVGDLPHRDVSHQRAPVGARDGDRDRVRPRERRAAVRGGEPRRRRGGQGRHEPRLRKPAGPVPEDTGREAVRGDDDARPLGRRLELAANDRVERQVPERAVALPALVAGLREQPLRLRLRAQVRQGREPVHAGEAVSRAPSRLRVQEVAGENLGRILAEAEPAILRTSSSRRIP